MLAIRPFVRRDVTYDPFREMEDMQRRFFGEDGFFKNDSLGAFKTDIQDKGDSYLLEADLPGFKKEDIKIDINGDSLVISAERHSEHEDKDKKGNYVCCERSYGSYQRSFDVSMIKTEDIKAEYTDGVLKLTLPKQVPAAPETRRLTIE